jgi:hypothetical protein
MAYVCRNYDEAVGTFAMRVAVRSNKWQPNERPLDPKTADTAPTHRGQ